MNPPPPHIYVFQPYYTLSGSWFCTPFFVSCFVVQSGVMPPPYLLFPPTLWIQETLTTTYLVPTPQKRKIVCLYSMRGGKNSRVNLHPLFMISNFTSKES